MATAGDTSSGLIASAACVTVLLIRISGEGGVATDVAEVREWWLLRMDGARVESESELAMVDALPIGLLNRLKSLRANDGLLRGGC